MIFAKEYRTNLFLTLLLSVCLISAASAVPETINLSGTLVDQNNTALSGTYDYRVRFYDAATAGNQLGGDVTGNMDVSLEGVFNLNVVPVTAVLQADAAWYELAIDTDQNGLDAGDVFGQRTAMHSVPYALMAQSASTLADADLLAATTIVAASASIGNASLTGNLHVDGVITGTYQGTIANADNASALGGTPAADWASDAELATGLATKADASHTHNLQDLSGAVTDAQVPDDITITEADTLDSVTSRGSMTNNGITVDTLSTGQGANELYAMDQNVRTNDSPTFSAVNTGQGANELYAMDQDVQTTDDVTFNQVSANAFYGDGSALTGIAGGLPTSGDQYVFPDLTTGMTDTQRGTALIEAVTAAKALGPSVTNRVAIIVPPGDYDLGGNSIELTSAYLDLVGLTTDRKAQYIYSGGVQSGSGVIYQTADHVYIANLVVECTNSSGSVSMNDPAAYYPNVSWQDSGTQIGSSANTEINNCEFIGDEGHFSWSMRIQSDYAGTYEDCTAGEYAFGTTGGDASGTFINCTAGSYSFASGSEASGTFVDCTAGDYSFAGTVSSGGEASGTFTRCTAGENSFANKGTASGTFTDCTGGNRSFGGSGTASGTFIRCTGEDYCFGDDAASGKFYDCTAGYVCFGGYGDEASGEFHNCTGGQYAFTNGSGATASGQFYNCIGGDDSFGGGGGTASGTFDDCTGGDDSFGGGGTASGFFNHCTGGDRSFGGGDGTASGVFRYCVTAFYGFGGGFGGTGSAAGGDFYFCEGESDAFTTNGSPTVINCIRGGSAYP